MRKFCIAVVGLIVIIQFSSIGCPPLIIPNDSIIVTPGKNFDRGIFFQILFGKHYRKIWAAPVKVEVFNIKEELGGLRPIKSGGNFQTKSLTLEDGKEREYVLRSINKDPSRALPKFLRNSPLGAVMLEQNTAENPYGALVLPYLARSAGIFYTIPKLCYIPNDTNFGKYTSLFSDQLFLFESRPKGDQSDIENYGRSAKVVNTASMLEKKYEDNDNIIDDKLYLRSRLFDMLVCDWGRHEDQWRWASYKNEEGILYKPIPRDRDHAFYKFDDGIIPNIASKFFLTKFQSFNSRYGSVRGLNLSAEFLDRRLLAGLDKNTWIQIADSLSHNVTYQRIEEAIRFWPPTVYQANGKETIRKLKMRRDKLHKAAMKYYNILAWQVEVMGTDKKEKFEVLRLDKKFTLVTVYKVNKEGELKNVIYTRLFNKKETNKIILLGLGGSDEFEVKGKVEKGIKVFVIGGENDKISDQSSVKGLSKKTQVYNYKEKNNLSVENETRLMRKLLWYDRLGFKRTVKN